MQVIFLILYSYISFNHVFQGNLFIEFLSEIDCLKS